MKEYIYWCDSKSQQLNWALVTFPRAPPTNLYVYFTIYTYLHQLFAMFSGRLQHLPEFKFPASTTHRLPPLKYKPRFQFFSGSHAMSSAKWSWYFTTILEYIKWFLVEKIRFFLKQKPLFTLFIVYFIWITYILRDVIGFQTLYKVR